MANRILAAVCFTICVLGVRSESDESDDAPVQLEIEHSLSSAGGKRVFGSRGTLFYSDPRRSVDAKGQAPLHTNKFKLAGGELDAFKV